MSTDDVSLTNSHQIITVETVNGYPSDNNNNGFSVTETKYDDLVRNSVIFWAKLRALPQFANNFPRIPIMAGRDLDLHRLFIEVTSRGGFEKVIADNAWRYVVAAFNFRRTMTGASSALKSSYLRFLSELERIYYFRLPASSIQPADEALNILANLSLESEEELAARIDEPELQVGCTVEGYIDGKFENGYLVTVKVGSEEMKGVLYHTPETLSQQPQQLTLETSSPPAVPSSSRRRYRKRQKVEAPKPKSNFCGYNFFYAEQRCMLKAEHLGRDSTLKTKIGKLWDNLTEAEKQVYNEKGVKVAESYKRCSHDLEATTSGGGKSRRRG